MLIFCSYFNIAHSLEKEKVQRKIVVIYYWYNNLRYHFDEPNKSFYSYFSLDLHHEIEVLRSKLKNSESHVTSMEREFVESKEYTDNEISKLQDELAKLRDRYDR